jgi:hypothetical protein
MGIDYSANLVFGMKAEDAAEKWPTNVCTILIPSYFDEDEEEGEESNPVDEEQVLELFGNIDEQSFSDFSGTNHFLSLAAFSVSKYNKGCFEEIEPLDTEDLVGVYKNACEVLGLEYIEPKWYLGACVY